MITIVTGALVAALALAGALSAMLFWQAKRASRAMDKHVASIKETAKLQILLAAAQVGLADKDRALNIVTAERDRLEFTIDTVEEQRDTLLKEALKNATPGSTAIAVRNALDRLRSFPPKLSETEDVPDVSGGADDNG